MPNDYLTLPRTKIRRKDRAVEDDAWIGSFLQRAAYGTLATVHNEQPFINSNLFVYDEEQHVIYLHTARVGRTAANVAASQQVCFSVSEMGRLLPADVALEFSLEYAGVTVFGNAHIVSDADDAEHGLQMLLDKYAPHLHPGRDYRPITPEELKRTTVFRIEIEDWSGKKKEVGPGFPGAFFFNREIPNEHEEHRQDGYFISTDQTKLDVDLIHGYLSEEAYWSRGISREKVEQSLEHSLCFGMYQDLGDKIIQIGFARVITDFATFAYLSDVFVLGEYQGQGLGKWFMECILAHPDLQGLRKWTLNTQDEHTFYHGFHFLPEPHPENYLVFRPGEPD